MINFYRIEINRHMIIKLSSLVSLFFLSALQQMVKQITISVPETQFRLIETQRGLISRSKFCQQLLQASVAYSILVIVTIVS